MYYSKIEPTFSIRIASLNGLSALISVRDPHSKNCNRDIKTSWSRWPLYRGRDRELRAHTHTHTCVRSLRQMFFSLVSLPFWNPFICNTATSCFFPSADRSYFFPFDSRRDGRFDRQLVDTSKCMSIIYEKKLWHTVVFAWAWN